MVREIKRQQYFIESMAYHSDYLYSSSGKEPPFSTMLDVRTAEEFNMNMWVKRWTLGIVVFGENILHIARRVAHMNMYDLQGEQIRKVFLPLPLNAWGLALYGSNGKNNLLVASNGTANLQALKFSLDGMRDPGIFVVDGTKTLGDLEAVDGVIWSVVPKSGCLVSIQQFQGKHFVSGYMFLHGLRNKLAETKNVASMSAIAWNPDHRTFYVTGHFWPMVFEIKVTSETSFERIEKIKRKCIR